jgi:hypothetical protein
MTFGPKKASARPALEHFRISTEKMPVSLIQALALTKRAVGTLLYGAWKRNLFDNLRYGVLHRFRISPWVGCGDRNRRRRNSWILRDRQLQDRKSPS